MWAGSLSKQQYNLQTAEGAACAIVIHGSSGAACMFSNWILLLYFIPYIGVRDCELEYLKNGSKVEGFFCVWYFVVLNVLG